jgi:hypothetical protein
MADEFLSIYDRPSKIIDAEPAAGGNVILLEQEIANLKAGERIKVHGWMVVDALGALVGLTANIGYTDDRGVRNSVIWPKPSIQFWDGGNVWRRNGEHHKMLSPVGHYVSRKAQAEVTFRLLLSVYCSVPAGRQVNVQSCGMTFERFP